MRWFVLRRGEVMRAWGGVSRLRGLSLLDLRGSGWRAGSRVLQIESLSYAAASRASMSRSNWSAKAAPVGVRCQPQPRLVIRPQSRSRVMALRTVPLAHMLDICCSRSPVRHCWPLARAQWTSRTRVRSEGHSSSRDSMTR